jgi:hypothetical protein
MLRRIFSFAILTLLAAGISHGKTPVEIHGRLQVSGNRIVGEKSNDTVQLTGMSLFWNNWEGQYFTKKTVDWLVDDFHCSIVRAPNGVDFSDGSVAGPGDIHNGKSMTSTVVEAASARGIYSIIDWHSHYAAKHTSDAVAYFDSMSTQYGSDPGVIFEIWNEPWANVYTWTEIKAYADEGGKLFANQNAIIIETLFDVRPEIELEVRRQFKTLGEHTVDAAQFIEFLQADSARLHVQRHSFFRGRQKFAVEIGRQIVLDAFANVRHLAGDARPDIRGVLDYIGVHLGEQHTDAAHIIVKLLTRRACFQVLAHRKLRRLIKFTVYVGRQFFF